MLIINDDQNNDHLIMVNTFTFKLASIRKFDPMSEARNGIHHFRINRSLAGWAHSQRRVGVNITIPLH